MAKKVIVIGTNHAGTSCVRNLRALDSNVEITTYDKNTNISFLGCGIALYVDGTVKNPNDLFYSTPELLAKSKISVKMQHEVIGIDSNAKTVMVKDLVSGKTFTDSYDKLVVAAGSWPIIPKLEGSELKNIEVCKIFQHAELIKQYATNKKIKNVVVVGAGYIGIELVEAFNTSKKNVTLIDLVSRPVPRYFDTEFTDELSKSMKDHKVNLAFGQKLIKFEGKDGFVKKVVTDKATHDADLVILAIGFSPNSSLLPTAEKTKNGAIKVDEYMRTSIKDIYAIGDCSAVRYIPTNDHQNVALATTAVKTGLVTAHHINNEKSPLKIEGLLGTNGICVFGHKLASTGLSEEGAKLLGLDPLVSVFEDNDRPEFMNDKGKERVKCKLVFDRKTRKLLGAQIGSYGEHNHSEAIFYISLAIQKGMTVEELALVDVYFLPHYNKPYNYILMAALNAPK
jgi:NADPH-dependent 2,4-dienoyl-CoA reductase/sulfur reductase-like enzyme